MKTLYLDCSNGISGDMTLAALLHAGADFDSFRAELGKLGLSGFAVMSKQVSRAGITGLKVDVVVGPDQPERNYNDIIDIISVSGISDRAKSVSLKVFGRLAEAEAEAHGVPVSDVHFHEVGAVDSIVDIVGAAVLLDMLGVGRIVSSTLNLGSGTVTFSHGTFPVPAPATAALVKGLPARGSDIPFEMTTPTGAAIVSALADGFGPMPEMVVRAVGYGAGGRDISGIPNMLRAVIGDAANTVDDPYETDCVTVVETNIDDMDPRVFEHVMARLLKAGALDVWLTSITMKKSRPGTTLSVICNEADLKSVVDIIMEETTTFGVRIREERRLKLVREISTVDTQGGPMRLKAGIRGGKILKAVPEYEDAKDIATRTGIPLREVLGGTSRDDDAVCGDNTCGYDLP